MPVTTGDLWQQRRGLVATDEGPVAPGRWKTQCKCTDILRDRRGQYIFKRVSIKPLQGPIQLASLAALPARRPFASGGDVNLRAR
jgi:hypothetical protein